MRRKLIAPAALIIGLSLLVVPAPTEAHGAAPPVLKVCNSSGSSGGTVIAYNGGNTTPAIGYGQCRDIFNGDGKARVAVLNGDYKIKPAGGSYGPRHNGPNPASNPPNVSKVYYHTLHF